MSYTLQIWETPTPTSAQEAEQICDQLSDEKAEQNLKFITLAQQLTQRYPCITQPKGNKEEGYENSVWSEGPFNGVCDQPIYGLGVVIDHVAEVMPFVCSTANALGLTVYDQQTGDTYVPSGVILTIADETIIRAPQIQSDKADKLGSDKQATRLAQGYISDLMEKRGFKWVEKHSWFEKPHNDFYHAFGVAVLGGNLYFSAHIDVLKNIGFATNFNLFFRPGFGAPVLGLPSSYPVWGQCMWARRVHLKAQSG